MTALVTLSCDRMRHGQPCRGSRPTRAREAFTARLEARINGWRSALVELPDGGQAWVDTCPSGGHDGEGAP